MPIVRPRSNLEVHHKEFRNHSGDDSEENLITLCTPCHDTVHRGEQAIISAKDALGLPFREAETFE
jgi:predicted HNH restriction endonuclease